MADIAITVDGGTTKKLLTAGKYCDRNIVVTATGGGGEPEPPQDGKTRLYIHVPPNSEPGRPPARNQVPLYIQQTVSQGVTIDWGDGSEPETLEGTGKVNTTHTYQEGGDFVIALEVAEGCELSLGHGSFSFSVMGSTNNDNRVYTAMLKKIILGDGIKSGGAYAFYNCYSLSNIILSIGISTINNAMFQNCYSVSSIIIPKSLETINSSAFSSCFGIKEYHFKPERPPYLSNTNAFSGIPSDCIIFVPKGSLEAYQTTTNWSTYADKMQEEAS